MSDDVIQPGELIEPEEVEVTSLAVDAAKAELDLEDIWRQRDKWERVGRTLLQGAVSAAVLAALTGGYEAVQGGHYDVKFVAVAAGQAALTAVVSFVHNKIAPKS